LETAPLDSYFTSNIMVSLKCELEVTQGHWKRYHSRARYDFLFAFHSNCSRRIFSHFGYIHSVSKNGLTLKSGFWVIQDHWKWRRSIDHIRLSIGLQQQQRLDTPEQRISGLTSNNVSSTWGINEWQNNYGAMSMPKDSIRTRCNF